MYLNVLGCKALTKLSPAVESTISFLYLSSDIVAQVATPNSALISADVDYKTAKEFTALVREKALGQEVLTTLKPGELLTKIMKDELASLMGSTSLVKNFRRFNLNQKLIN